MERSRNKGLMGLWAGDLVSTIRFLTVWPYELPEVISFLGCKLCPKGKPEVFFYSKKLKYANLTFQTRT